MLFFIRKKGKKKMFDSPLSRKSPFYVSQTILDIE